MALKNLISLASLAEIIANGLQQRCWIAYQTIRHLDDSSMNVSATKLLIENQTKGGDYLRYNLLSRNGSMKFN